MSFKEGLLRFRCSSKYKVGKTAKVKLTLVYAEAMHVPTVSVRVVSLVPEGDGTFLCTATLELSEAKLAELIPQMARAGVEGPDRRASRRLPCTLRILSKELASFRAVTTNINLTGVELQCDNPVAPGHRMNLQFDLETAGIRELRIPAVCVWSLAEVDESRRTRYRVGVGFLDQSPESASAWGKFYRNLLANEGASVMLKTIDGDSVVDKRAESGAQTALSLPMEEPSSRDPGGSPPAVPAAGFVPPVGSNPFAPAPAAPPSQLNFVTPPAAVPSPHQMGGGFNTQAAAPPPVQPNKLRLPPASLPTAAKEPGGLQLPPATPPVPQVGGLGFSTPPAGGFSFPPSQPSMPSSGLQLPSPPGSSGFSFPTPATGGGFAFPSSNAPQAPSQPLSGLSLPPASPAAPTGGFSFPSSPVKSEPSPFTFSPPSPSGAGTPASPGGGFSLPGVASKPEGLSFFTPPSQQQGFPPPQQQGFAPPQQSGFPPAAPAAGFPPAAPSSGFPAPTPPTFRPPTPGPAPPAPETVVPLSINGAQLSFRGRLHEGYGPGSRRQVSLTFEVGASQTSVTIEVSLTRIEPAPDGTAVYWCTVLEEERRIQVLNQLIG